jgi:predicted GIY-YIG superfamily endonuclease
MKMHTLYRFYDVDGRLLYIGRTMNPSARFKQHKADKDWWPEVAEIKMRQFESSHDLDIAERLAIRQESPAHNVVFNKPAATKASEKMGMSTNSVDKKAPRFTCRYCRNLCSGRGSFVHLPAIERRQADICAEYWWQLDHRTQDSRIPGFQILTGKELLDAPDKGRWVAICSVCLRRKDDARDSMDSSTYEIELNRADTWQKVTAWTIHLMGKNWFSFTNWCDVIYDAGAKE